jgi:hypothetical protein
VPDAVVADVERLGIATVQQLDPVPEVRLGRLDQQMHVVRHEAVTKEMPPLPLRDVREQMRIRLVILVISKDPTPIHATGNDVVSRTSNLISQSTPHTR